LWLIESNIVVAYLIKPAKLPDRRTVYLYV